MWQWSRGAIWDKPKDTILGSALYILLALYLVGINRCMNG